MRVLYIARLFSGLEASVSMTEWNPTGVPTIYKMVEALDREDIELAILLTQKKNVHETVSIQTDRNVQFKGLRTMVSVLAGPNHFPPWLGGQVASKLSEIRQLGIVLIRALRFHPNLIYIDHSNIWAAGILARIAKCPVVLRVMGVYPSMRVALLGKRPAHVFVRWCYRAPYSLVVCTQDGSGVERWLETAMLPVVRKLTLLNGVDEPAQHFDDEKMGFGLPRSKCIVLFLGKLEHAKGSTEFLEGFLRARDKLPGAFHALIVGNGSMLLHLKERVAAAGAIADVSFVERLAHTRVWDAFQKSDIYVSLNRLGNLSNSNLEAIKAGCCMIIPSSQSDTCVDTATDALLPADAVVRIPSTDSIDDLADALVMLCGDPVKRKTMQMKLKAVGNSLLKPWDARINAEIAELRSLAQTKVPMQ